MSNQEKINAAKELGTEAFHNGRPVRILATDSDPRAAWWIVYEDAPDQDAFVLHSELEEIR